MMHRFWRPIYVAALLILPRATVSFASLSKSVVPWHLSSVAASSSSSIMKTSSTLSASTESSSDINKIENAPPVNGIPGKDLTENQPLRNAIGQASHALIVGGNRGIGLEFVKQCSDRGAKVVATHRGSEVPENLQALVDDPNRNVETLQMDVSDENSIVDAAKELQSRNGFTPLTHVVHSAGAYYPGMSFDGTSRGGRPPQPVVTKDDMMSSFLINSVGPLMVAQNFVRLLGRSPGTPEKDLPVYSILTSKVGSIYDNTSGGTYAYRSSKSALNNICKSLSVDLAGEASVVLLHPGFVKTDMTGGKGLIDATESVEGMLRAIEATDATVGFRFVDFKACLIPW